MALLALAALLLFTPGFNTTEPPPETRGNDIVLSGADFLKGELDGAGVVATGAGEVLTLAPSRAQGGYTSEPVGTEYPFNALGLHWVADNPPGTEVRAEVRFSEDGSSWSEWREVIVSDEELPDHINQTSSAGEAIGQLVFAEFPARLFQYRFSLAGGPAGEAPEISRLTASYIDAKGYHESPLSVAAVKKKAAAFINPAPADAQPAIISRAQWGANEAYMTWGPEYVAPRKQIVHHTVTSNGDPNPAATVRSIYYYHAVSLGWGDIGYNFLIDQQGRIYEGRYGGNGVVGGHALSWNYGSIGISALGNYETGGPTWEMLWAFVSLMSWKSNQNYIDPWGNDYLNGANAPNYLGHRDTYSTACPGGSLYNYLPWLRNEARARYAPYPIIGAIGARYNQLGGAPGAPTGYEYAITGGRAQDFTNGRLMWNSTTGRVYWVYGAILARYDQADREDGMFSWPQSDEYGVSGGRATEFQGGHIYWSSAAGARIVYGAILTKYLALGGPAVFGVPVSDEFDTPDFSGFRESDFQRGRIYWSDATGARAVYGAIFAKFKEKGALDTFDMPLADEEGVAGRPGARVSRFGGAHIYWSATTGAHEVHGAIFTKFEALGGVGFSGLPLSDETNVAGVAGARMNQFERAHIYWSPATGAREVHGAILGKYLAMGGPPALGLPLSDEGAVSGRSDGARFNDFERAYIGWTPARGARIVYGAIFTRFKALGGVGLFGLPATDEYGVPGGRASDFENGQRIYWSPSTGARAVSGAILTKYLALGGPGGWVGFPKTDVFNPGVTGAQEVDFQGANIYWSDATGAHEVHGAIRAKYVDSAVGGPAGDLGLPTSDEYGITGGRANDFQGGYISWTPSGGAQVLPQ